MAKINKYTFTGKTVDEAVNEAANNLNVDSNEIIFNEKETKKTLFNKKVEIEVIDKRDIITFIKEYLNELITNMGITNPRIEVKNREDNLIFSVYSDNNAILIGKNGKNIDALQTVVKQVVYKEIGQPFNLVIDVSEYKRRNQMRIEKLAKYTAKEVATTKIAVQLDPMNSYERRIIHNILTNSRDVYTESIGEEPNRCVVIKPKEE